MHLKRFDGFHLGSWFEWKDTNVGLRCSVSTVDPLRETHLVIQMEKSQLLLFFGSLPVRRV